MARISQINVNSTTYDLIDKQGRVLISQADYNALVQAGTVDPDVDYHIYDSTAIMAVMNDTITTTSNVWSASKVSSEISSRIDDALTASY